MKAQQRGFTLVELMVAMIIGLILTLAALQLFLTNQRTFALQQALAELHEDGQMITRYMTADIRQAGRGSAIAGSIPPVVVSDSSNGTNDVLSIHYWGTSTCAGDEYTGETEIQNTYSVSGDVLQCSSDLTGNTVDLISGVESFQVLYGLDTVKDEAFGVTEFMPAGAPLDAALAADSVIVAIRFALLLSTDRFTQVEAANQTHWVLDQSVNSNDNNLRRVYSATVQLRNYDWAKVHCKSTTEITCDEN